MPPPAIEWSAGDPDLPCDVAPCNPVSVDTGGMNEGLRFSILGPLTVERSGHDVDIGGPKQRLLLAVLLLSANRPVAVDRLIQVLWGDSAGSQAQSALHVYVAKLRKALGSGANREGLIQTVRPGYRIVVDASQLDLLEFTDLVSSARQTMAADPSTASSLFGRAIALWQGPFLADIADNEYVNDRSHEFERDLSTAMIDRYECDLLLGRHSEVLGELERAAREDPFNERLCGLLMVALYRSGRQVDALDAYGRLRRGLAEELGIEPSPAMQDLELQILDHAVPDVPMRGPEAPDVALPTVTRVSRSVATGILELDGERIPLTRSVTTIGRSPDRTVVVSDLGVSRRHAEIRRTDPGYVLVDVGSTNGTSVNDHRVANHLLASGDRIRVGDAILTFWQT